MAHNVVVHKSKEARKDSVATDQVFTWRAPEFVHIKKSKLWYTLSGALFVIIVLGFFVLGNWLGGFVVVIMAGLFYSQANLMPRVLGIRISDKGVEIEKSLYNFGEIRSFTVRQAHGRTQIGLNLLHGGLTAVNFLLPKERETEIIDFLNRYSPIEATFSFSHWLSTLIRY